MCAFANVVFVCVFARYQFPSNSCTNKRLCATIPVASANLFELFVEKLISFIHNAERMRCVYFWLRRHIWPLGIWTDELNWIALAKQCWHSTLLCVGCEILSPPQNLRTMTDSANCAHLSRLINLNDARAKIRCVAVNGEGWVREELMSPCVHCASYRFILMSPFTIKLWLTICI